MNEISLMSTTNPQEKVSKAQESLAQWTKSLVQLWILGEKLVIPKLQNLATDKLVLVCSSSKFPTLMSSIDIIYKNTADGSPLRRLAVDSCAWMMQSDVFKKLKNIFTKDFLIDLTMTFSRATSPLEKECQRRKIKDTDFHISKDAPDVNPSSGATKT
ncbi:hypothetical protein G7Y89_g15323 [Cudoniella acicularis]|uniref:Uncharacterized protein n=1 Tax=Cudoniella acicularis TaxID=354080 RepID=A0A8H4VND4_9HELO|nr:hypothetical protein G7Y89_g15323 [Cudoniella acicularis]